MTTSSDGVQVIKIGRHTFRLKFAHLLRPLTERERQDLKNSIRKHGVKAPVIVDRDDNVIDGANRVAILAELGGRNLPVEKLPHVMGDDKAQELAYDLNAARRHLTQEEREKIRAERKERAAKARAGGMSTRAIAELEGVDHSTIVRDGPCSTGADAPVEHGHPDTPDDTPAPQPPPPKPAKVKGRDAKVRPATKPTPDDIAARRERVAELHQEGKTVREIASELGVSVGTVVADVKAAAQESASEPQPEPDPATEVETQAPRWHVPLDAVRPEGRDHAAEVESLCAVIESTAASMRSAGNLEGAAAAFRLCVEAVRASLATCGVRL